MIRKARILTGCLVLSLAAGAVWGRDAAGLLQRLTSQGIGIWTTVAADSPRLTPSMRLALADAPEAVADDFAWAAIDDGFDVADLPVEAEGRVVDHILLARKAGAFVAGAGFAAIRDLGAEDWREAFQGADNAMVSYPLLLANGENRVRQKSDWIANRSFVGQDRAGRIVIGTTTDAFFSLDRMAQFLLSAPLDLDLALNLDGGPVACQGVTLNGFRRRSYGRWETQVDGKTVKLLSHPYGAPAMPIVLAVLPRADVPERE
jgi:hypothetical protein